MGTENDIDGRWNVEYLYGISGAVRIESKIRLRRMLVITANGSVFLKKEKRELKYIRQIKVLRGIFDYWVKHI